ncbi:MAG: hypothetical protein K2H89_06375, partial [Oscillospiraceae bacterium]|nr:hypothetical protein [Oscillospiraceae bacterium]
MQLIIFGILFFLVGAVVFYPAVAASVIEAGQRCVSVLIPSLYLFSILAALIVRTRLLFVLAKPVQKFFRNILHRDAVLCMILIFSQIGGYPVGAQILHQLYQQKVITRQQEQNLLCVCMGSGFGFILGTAGGTLQTALLLWAVISLPNIILGWFLIRDMYLENQQAESGISELVSAFTQSVESAAQAMLKICAMILAFSGLMGIIRALLGHMPLVIESILEVSCVTEYLQHGGTLAGAAAFLSFGGICVHLQIAAITENHLHFLKFWLFRILIAGIVFILSRIILGYCMPDVA